MKYAFLSYQLALKTGNPYWIAKTAEFISDIFSHTTTLDERLKYQQIAVENYKTAAYLDNYEYALCDLSTALINCGYISHGLEICDSVMKEAVKKGNYAVADYAKSYLLDGYVRNENYKKRS